LYGNKVALLLQLEITYADGSNETIGSDESWRSSDGSIRSSEITTVNMTTPVMKKKDGPRLYMMIRGGRVLQ